MQNGQSLDLVIVAAATTPDGGLSLHYRTIYRVVGIGDHAVIEVLEVNKHAY